MPSSYDSNFRAATAVAFTGSDQQVTTDAAVLMGFDVNDDSIGNVHIHIYNGTSTADQLICGGDPSNGGHATRWFGPNGIACPDGIFVNATSGAPTGSLYYR